MRIVPTGLLSIAILGAATTPGWCPVSSLVPGNAKAYVGGTVRPHLLRKVDPGRGKLGPDKQFTSSGSVGGTRTPSGSKTYQLKPPALPQLQLNKPH
jgi:hypothetical protein